MSYNRYSVYLKNKYGEKVYKLPVQLPVTCPNRIHGQGCTFCSEIGTGFEALAPAIPVSEQLQTTQELIARKYKATKYIAYFQNYTNTFLPIETFESYMIEAASFPNVVEISISTRPDCIDKLYLDVLQKIKEQYGVNITVELGLQTANYHVLNDIERGHGLAEYISACLLIKSYGFSVCTHIILNLPGDNLYDTIETAKIVSVLKTDIVKIHSLYLAKHTKMAEEYQKGNFAICSKEEYYIRLKIFLEHLDPAITIERLFSRIPEEDAVFSNWNTSWWKLLDEFTNYMNEEGAYQGRLHQDWAAKGLSLLNYNKENLK